MAKHPTSRVNPIQPPESMSFGSLAGKQGGQVKFVLQLPWIHRYPLAFPKTPVVTTKQNIIKPKGSIHIIYMYI